MEFKFSEPDNTAANVSVQPDALSQAERAKRGGAARQLPLLQTSQGGVELVLTVTQAAAKVTAVGVDGAAYTEQSKQCSSSPTATDCRSVLARAVATLPEPLQGSVSRLQVSQAAARLLQDAGYVTEAATTLELQQRTGVPEGTPVSADTES